MSRVTFPRLTGAALAACLAVGLAHQGYATLRSRRHHAGYTARIVRCGSGNILTCHLRPGEPGGPTLVCEAGLLSTSLIWRLVADHLPPAISLVLYDRAGYRRSLRRCQENYCLQESVADLLDVVQAGVDPESPCFLAGHSLGGYLVHRAAAALPDRFRGLVLIDPNHPRELNYSPRQRAGAQAVAMPLELAPWSTLFGGGMLLDKQNMLASAEGSPYYRMLRLEASAPALWRAALREWRYSYPFMLDGGRQLAELAVPITVLAAESTLRDLPEHKDLLEEYVASGSGGELVTIDGSTHQSILTGVGCAPLTSARIGHAVEQAG